jgi:hypothetical protein
MQEKTWKKKLFPKEIILKKGEKTCGWPKIRNKLCIKNEVYCIYMSICIE